MAIKIDWDRVQRQSRLGKERYMGFTVKARSGISPDAPLCTRYGAWMPRSFLVRRGALTAHIAEREPLLE